MRVTGTASDPRVVGKIEVIRGRYSFSGHQFDLEQGVISFNGPMMNPTLAIRAETKISDVTAGIAVGGTAQRPDIAFVRSEEHTSELQSLMRISYAVFCLKKQNTYLKRTVDILCMTMLHRYQ